MVWVLVMLVPWCCATVNAWPMKALLSFYYPVEEQTGQVSGEIEVISRGFVYVRENQEIIDQIKDATHDVLKTKRTVTNWGALRKKVEIAVERLVYEVTERRPLIINRGNRGLVSLQPLANFWITLG
jgi:hypothetical protein